MKDLKDTGILPSRRIEDISEQYIETPYFDISVIGRDPQGYIQQEFDSKNILNERKDGLCDITKCICCLKNKHRNPEGVENGQSISPRKWTPCTDSITEGVKAINKNRKDSKFMCRGLKSNHDGTGNTNLANCSRSKVQKNENTRIISMTNCLYGSMKWTKSNTAGISVTTFNILILITVLSSLAASQDLQQLNLSLVIDNLDYVPGMEKNISREFTDLADMLCDEISNYFTNEKVEKRQHVQEMLRCHVDQMRKTTAGKVEVSLRIKNPYEMGDGGGVVLRILQKSKRLTQDGTEYIDIRSNLIPVSSLHVTNTTGRPISNQTLDSERSRRGLKIGGDPVVTEGTTMVTTTLKPRPTTVGIEWATNWWDVFLSRYNWGGNDIFGPNTGSTLSRVPEVDSCLYDDPCQNGGTCASDDVPTYCICTAGWTGQYCEKDEDECLKNPCNGRDCTNTLGSFRCGCPDGFTGNQCTKDIDECKTNPCQNNGMCINTRGSFSCKCQQGWTSKTCQQDVNECDSNPCKEGTACVNKLGTYTCECDNGWEGKNCTNDVDECLSSPCGGRGICENTVGSFKCTCDHGWLGNTCQEDINECVSSPCMHGGLCKNSNGSYTCLCGEGWGGKDCNQDVDECLSSPCGSRGICENMVGSFKCNCEQGWLGDNCQEDVDECVSSPCMHGGLCKNSNGSYTCLCSEGWGDRDCNRDIDECLSFPCGSRGTCENTVGSFKCNCEQGWLGDNCQEDEDECVSSPCMHGGLCKNSNGSYTCLCSEGWGGRDCNEDIDECQIKQPCANDGICKNTIGSFECACSTGWSGQNCTEDVDECSHLPCGEDVPCFNVEGSYSCQCPPEWTGKNCTEDVDECLRDPELCNNGGICNNTEGSYRCECTNNWTGRSCEEDVDECLTSPCPDGSSCVNLIGSFQCNCMDGWTGQYCETDVDECLLADCGNGGICNNYNGSYDCDCPDGFTGTPCRDVDECKHNQCVNEGTCENTLGSFVCRCTSGWNGELCDTDVDECVQSPCFNGGVCQNNVGAYHCDCPTPWVGQNCTARMFVMGAEADYGSGVTISCGVQRLQDWKSIDVKHGNMTLYQIRPDGLFTDFTGGKVKINSTIGGSGADLSLTFQTVRCEDDGKYHCTVDGNSKNTMNLIVKKPSSGEPTRIYQMEGIVNDRRTVNVHCQGHPSYPHGSLKFQVKLKNESVYKDYNFPIEVRNELSIDCWRTQTMYVNYIFGQEWDQASIRCVDGDSGNFDETVLDVIPDNYCARAPFSTESFLEHPHDPKKYVHCFNQQPRAVMVCETDTCFHENEQQCGSCIKECPVNTCDNDASCWIINGDLTCDCKPGWSGSLCEIDVDECLSSPCRNGGLCQNFPGTYNCVCAAGWQGTVCGEDVNECLMNPCANGGRCSNTIASYTCTCPNGWTGKQCDIDIDECLTNPCLNGGTCLNTRGAFVCLCSSGWNGTLCEKDVDECLMNPCINGGRCINLIGSFSCNCPQPWFGKICESGLFVDGHRGEMNSVNVTAVTCTIYKYKDWKRLDIIRSDRNNRPVVRVNSNGGINSILNKRNIQVIYTPDTGRDQAEVSLQFTRLRCRDEGVYRCLLDNNQKQDARIVVTNPARGTPTISKIEELYGEANIAFNCTGLPGYPDGDLEFQIKLQNETKFRDFTFYSATRQNIDMGCVRKQIVNSTYFMNMEWNQAAIRCKSKSSDLFDETNVYLLSPEICASVPINSGIRHPYNPGKYITCTIEAPKVRNCPGTTCFDDRTQQCLFTCDYDD